MQPGMFLDEVQRSLAAASITFVIAEPAPGLPARINIMDRRIEFIFDDEGGLHSIIVHLDG